MLGPGFTKMDLIGIAAFAANYAIVAPVSAVCVVVAVVRRKKRSPRWLAPIAVVNLLIAGTQLVLIGSMEWWLVALLLLQGGGAVAVLVWIARSRRGPVDA